jgi:hypothetical protein
MYGDQMTITAPTVIGHSTVNVTAAGTGSVAFYTCIYNSAGTSLLWSSSVSIGTGTGGFSGSATQYTLPAGTYLVTWEQTGTTGAVYESWSTNPGQAVVLNKQGTRDFTVANAISAGACQATTGTLTAASGIAPVLIALEP